MKEVIRTKDNNKSKESVITDRVTALLEMAAGEQLVSRAVNANGEEVAKVDLNALQTVVKILKAVGEIKKELSENGERRGDGGVVLLPKAE